MSKQTPVTKPFDLITCRRNHPCYIAPVPIMHTGKRGGLYTVEAFIKHYHLQALDNVSETPIEPSCLKCGDFVFAVLTWRLVAAIWVRGIKVFVGELDWTQERALSSRTISSLGSSLGSS